MLYVQHHITSVVRLVRPTSLRELRRDFALAPWAGVQAGQLVAGAVRSTSRPTTRRGHDSLLEAQG